MVQTWYALGVGGMLSLGLWLAQPQEKDIAGDEPNATEKSSETEVDLEVRLNGQVSGIGQVAGEQSVNPNVPIYSVDQVAQSRGLFGNRQAEEGSKEQHAILTRLADALERKSQLESRLSSRHPKMQQLEAEIAATIAALQAAVALQAEQQRVFEESQSKLRTQTVWVRANDGSLHVDVAELLANAWRPPTEEEAEESLGDAAALNQELTGLAKQLAGATSQTQAERTQRAIQRLRALLQSQPDIALDQGRMQSLLAEVFSPPSEEEANNAFEKTEVTAIITGDGQTLTVDASNLAGEAAENTQTFIVPDGGRVQIQSANSLAELNSRRNQQKLLQKIQQEWNAAEAPEAKAAAIKKLSQMLEERFDQDLAQRKSQVAELESKLEGLRQQVTRREDSREEILKVQTRAIEMRWDGLDLLGESRSGKSSSGDPQISQGWEAAVGYGSEGDSSASRFQARPMPPTVPPVPSPADPVLPALPAAGEIEEMPGTPAGN